MVDKLYEAPLEARPAVNPLADQSIKNKLIRSLYGQQGFAKQHIDSYDEFVNHRIGEIITSKLNRRVISDSVSTFWLEYTDIRVAHPTFEKNYDCYSRSSALYPH
jgi:DNA-directed RNA polymerase III subunit RPC2